MSTQWMVIQSFQHSQDILAAINALSIHTKIRLTGNPDREREKAVAHARETLNTFLKEMDPIVRKVEEEGAKPVLGVDTRLRQLARGFAAARKDRWRFKSELFRNDFMRTQELLYSEEEEDLKVLLHSLQELRTLLEEHVNTDATQLLGEI